ncbi:MAG: DUF4468 domain-containing protein [Saprospiraceae bacterium]
MKKTLLILILIVSCYAVLAQESKWPDSLNITLPTKDGNIYYEQIVNVDSVDKNQLFNAARIWFSNTFKSAKSVLDLDDRNTGRLIGNGNLTYSTSLQKVYGERRASFKIDITLKDGKYRVIISDIEDISTGGYGDLNKYNYENLHPEVKQKFKEKFKYATLSAFDMSVKILIASLNKAIMETTKDSF